MSIRQQLLLGFGAAAGFVSGGNDGFTVLLGHFDGTNGSTTFVNSAVGGSSTLNSNGACALSTAQQKFGTASVFIDGSVASQAAYVSGGTADYTFGTGDWTVDFWFRPTVIPGPYILYDHRDPGSGSALAPVIYVPSVIKFFAGGSDLITGTTTPVINTWYHVAVAKSGGSTKLFVNGTQEGSTYSDSNNYVATGTSRPALGISGTDFLSFPLTGYLEEVRVSKGIARWTSNFSPPSVAYTTSGSYSLTYLVVAGGGGGGGGQGGGGGAGGFRTASGYSVNSGTSYTATVGAGGAGATGASGDRGSLGSNSVFDTITSTGGGGGGGGAINRTGAVGGSGGGGSGPNAGGAGTGGQGNTGGNGATNVTGGGGGASAVGANGVASTNAGVGGAGTASSISGGSVTYAGGGGGGTSGGASVGAGGAGGGGGGSSTDGTPGGNGTANTGGGGGGSGFSVSGGTGGTGGSGIVIISYPNPQKGVGGTVTSSGGNTIHTFTSSGTFIA